ncbi:hypothetical protein ACEWPM_013105 [Roseovarius sp. S4756]|uniref:sulfotransferase-like domain-containing protein n=1 Tax=Roseovarius maritimus TaxID=3342637 RepID=UPI00372C95F2
MHPIYALWSHPRSMSTAMERVMRERGDLDCHHEPFMYDYYLHRQVRKMPHFEAEADRPVSYEAVRKMLLERAAMGPVFIKDMSYYVMPRIMDDAALSDALVNCFLIRDPVASILSYFKIDPDATCEEIGLEAQAQHFKALQDRGITAPVICAEDVRRDTKGTVSALWRAIGLPPADHAFSWQEEQPEDWKQVGEWHGTASSSTGIAPISEAEVAEKRRKFAELVQKQPRAQEYLDYHLPHYEMLKAHALQV